MSGPIDTGVKLAQCPRCQGYVFAAVSGGFKVAADPAPVTRDGYVQALAAGRRLFGLATVGGRPHKLLTRTRGSRPPAFAENGAQLPPQGFQHAVLAEHGCGAHGMDATAVEVKPEDPRPRPVTPGAHRAGPLPQPVPAASATTASAPAGRVSRHLSRGGSEAHIPAPRCDICATVIGAGEMRWGIEHNGRWVYARHEECP